MPAVSPIGRFSDQYDTENGRRVKHALGEWLQTFEWSHFLTLTFRRESEQDFARRQFTSYIARLERESGRSLTWFYGTEYGKRLGRLHMHALTANTDELGMRLVKEWYQENGPRGYAKVLRYDPTLGAVHYVTKYAVKDIADWDMSSRLATTPLFGAIVPLGTHRRVRKSPSQRSREQ